MSVELLNIDCMEYMATQPDNSFDLAIVDPPYGNKWDAVNLVDGPTNKAIRTNLKVTWDKAPDHKYFEELKRVSKNQIIWGVNFYKNVDLAGGRICWDKKGTAFGRAELAYYSGSMSVNVCEIIWNGMIQHDMKNKETRIHPTQKPVALYNWLFQNYAEKGQRILDTHLGSASSAIAAHYFGCDFVGCEIDKEYYDAARARFKRETRQLAMF